MCTIIISISLLTAVIFFGQPSIVAHIAGSSRTLAAALSTPIGYILSILNLPFRQDINPMSDPSQSEYRTIYSRVCSGCYHCRNSGDHRDIVSADTASAATRRPVSSCLYYIRGIQMQPSICLTVWPATLHSGKNSFSSTNPPTICPVTIRIKKASLSRPGWHLLYI